ncbi:glycoside hydrolase family 3 N-terminal domain-containing protein [Stenotrophomonas sp.]|uniref:glycoside hydrolase family 3 N-terminal domain-containing protein n=1 Tax=Stenotrophomonas sp. TaxID=69392 RepID=UPI0028AEFEFC|nr:glycoside hydrolase family 3 N-terminal domain-containing protein [Stenotrophomonas sp.]
MSNRIDTLMAQMTLEEKVGQLNVTADMVRPFAPDINPVANTQNAEQVLQLIRQGKVGSLFNGKGRDGAVELQRVAVEESRLGIPVILAADVIHGMGTVFPIPLGETASFEPDLARRTARATAVEATAAAIHWTYAPAIDVTRDQRWSRGAEGTGEDTLLACRFGAARVQGFQGDDLTAEHTLLATAKHYVAYGASLAGLDYNTVEMAPQTLRDVHLPPFQAAVDAGVASVMSSFNDINGVPASANKPLLVDVLRGEWRFNGITISDYTSEMELVAHGYAEDMKDAVLKAFMAGLDLSLQSGLYLQYLPELVREGAVPMWRLDQAVRRMLELKERIGLLDDPYRSLRMPDVSATQLAEHDALARDAARRSVVLLRNEGNVLPLKKVGQRIAVIGPFGRDRDNIEGCWTLFGDASRYVSLEDGLRAAVEDPQQLQFVDGCRLEDAIEGGIAEAVAAAQAADVVILALGEPQRYSGEAQSRIEITLPAAQQALADAVADAGTPVVALVRNGRALALHGGVRDADALLITWFLGSQTGHALADVLFGDYSPSGRLPVSFPQASGQQPYYYNHPRTGRPELPDMKEFKTRWREISHEALYPFGHGLTYGVPVYGPTMVSADVLERGGSIRVSACIRNEGARMIEEVAQLYTHDRVASRVRPVRELKGFDKIAIAPGETVEVAFLLEEAMLAFTGVDGVRRAEPGAFDVWIAPSCTGGTPARFVLA